MELGLCGGGGGASDVDRRDFLREAVEACPLRADGAAVEGGCETPDKRLALLI